MSLNPMESEVAVQAASTIMATYHQYSEIVAAYGNRMPPPSRPQGPRLTLPFVYAAIGAVLGTFTGTAAAVISLQPGVDSVASHLSLASFTRTGSRIHSIANAGQQPVIQNHGNSQTAHAAQPAATPVTSQAAPTVQALTVQKYTPASSQIAHLDKPSAIPSHVQSQTAHAAQTAPVKTAVKLAVTASAPASIKVAAKAAVTAAALTASASPAKTAIPAAHKPVLPVQLAADSVPAQTLDTTSVTPAPIAAEPLDLDSGAKVQLFYSEGDATVASYNAAGDTIETDDGRTFVVGTTVSVSSATSWDDYHANVHYRCDQNGHCTLTRMGVIALNARLI
jgi:hypothetical protein